MGQSKRVGERKCGKMDLALENAAMSHGRPLTAENLPFGQGKNFWLFT